MSPDEAIICPACLGHGSHTGQMHRDGKGNEEWEPYRCETCDGFGRVTTAQAVKVAAGGAPPLTPEGNAARWRAGCPEHVELWDAIHDYADARGRTSSCIGSPAMARAVVRVESAVVALYRVTESATPQAEAKAAQSGAAAPLTPEGFICPVCHADRRFVPHSAACEVALASTPSPGRAADGSRARVADGDALDVGSRGGDPMDPLLTTAQAVKLLGSRGAPPLTPEALNARLLACGWERPVLYGDRFTLWDDGDPHGKVYLVCPGGTMVPFGSCEGDIDEQRVRFIMDACNAVLGAKPAQSGAQPLSPEGIDEPGLSAAYAAYLVADGDGDARFTLNRDSMRAAITAYLRAQPTTAAPEGTTTQGAIRWGCPRCGEYFPSLCASRDPLVLVCRACAEAERAAAEATEGPAG